MSAARHEGAYSIDVALDYRVGQPTSILLAIEALEDGEQELVGEELIINGALQAPSPRSTGPARYRWISVAAGDLSIRYRAEARVARDVSELVTLPLTPYAALPPEVAPWLFASRHCDPTRFERILADEMNLPAGWVADGSTIALIRDWIRGHLSYEPVSTAETTATDTYIARAGVCRDYAHLMIALARAAGVPARFVSAYAWQLDPPDFHAVAEVWMAGRWHMVDATGLAPEASLVRIARVSDAVDASFMTIFGNAEMLSQRIMVSRA